MLVAWACRRRTQQQAAFLNRHSQTREHSVQNGPDKRPTKTARDRFFLDFIAMALADNRNLPQPYIMSSFLFIYIAIYKYRPGRLQTTSRGEFSPTISAVVYQRRPGRQRHVPGMLRLAQDTQVENVLILSDGYIDYPQNRLSTKRSGPSSTARPTSPRPTAASSISARTTNLPRPSPSFQQKWQGGPAVCCPAPTTDYARASRHPTNSHFDKP